ncbi:phosphatase PAP2 family protein [Cystobacter fuscus]|nr:phosphatase PAP2 family protein [Cystobacter fuscus]
MFGLLLVLLLLGGGFLTLLEEVREKDTQSFDEQVLRALRRADDPAEPLGPRWLAEAARDVTALGSLTVLTLVVIAVCGFLVLVRRWRTIALVLGSTLGGMGVNALLKNLVARPRPSVVPHLTWVLSESFPSGHAMLSAIVYLTLGAILSELVEKRWLKVYLLTVALGLTLLVGLTRVYLGVHYPTDVVGGWIAGLAWAIVAALVARVARRRSPGLREEARGDTAPS